MEGHVIYGVTNHKKSNIMEMVIWFCKENHWKNYTKGKINVGKPSLVKQIHFNDKIFTFKRKNIFLDSTSYGKLIAKAF